MLIQEINKLIANAKHAEELHIIWNVIRNRLIDESCPLSEFDMPVSEPRLY